MSKRKLTPEQKTRDDAARKGIAALRVASGVKRKAPCVGAVSQAYLWEQWARSQGRRFDDKHPVPPWCRPTPRADLFNLALQSGKTVNDALEFGMGHYGRGAEDMAAMPGEEWDYTRAHSALDRAIRNRVYAAVDRNYAIGTEAGEMDMRDQLALFGNYTGSGYRDPALPGTAQP